MGVDLEVLSFIMERFLKITPRQPPPARPQESVGPHPPADVDLSDVSNPELLQRDDSAPPAKRRCPDSK